MKPSVDETYQDLAARYIRRQIKQLTGQIEGIRKAEDLEFVHRARVASRRLRAALGVFAETFSPERLKAWRKEIQSVGRGLGDARDKDVQIDFLSGVLGRLEDPALCPGISLVLVRSQKKRDQLQPEVLRATGRLLTSRALNEMLVATKKMLGKKAEPKSPSPALFDHAQKQILCRFDELYAFRGCLANPQAYEQHHAMRIAAKRLRYTMEIFKPLYAGRLDGAIEAIKQMQTLLGDIHDCDVWNEQLEALLDKRAKRLKMLYGHTGVLKRCKVGIEHLQQDRRRYRQEAFVAMVDYWEKLTREGLWDELVQVVRSRGQAPAEPQAAEPQTAAPQTAAPQTAEATPSDVPAVAAEESKPELAAASKSDGGQSKGTNGDGSSSSKPAELPARQAEHHLAVHWHGTSPARSGEPGS